MGFFEKIKSLFGVKPKKTMSVWQKDISNRSKIVKRREIKRNTNIKEKITDAHSSGNNLLLNLEAFDKELKKKANIYNVNVWKKKLERVIILFQKYSKELMILKDEGITLGQVKVDLERANKYLMKLKSNDKEFVNLSSKFLNSLILKIKVRQKQLEDAVKPRAVIRRAA
jgi:hypothetical protein